MPSAAAMTDALPRIQRSVGEGRIFVDRRAGAVRIANLFQQGSAKIRLPSTHDADRLEAALINTSGGLTGGDSFAWHARAGRDCSLTLSTPACEKVYRSASGTASATIQLEAQQGAHLAWLPQETILFEDCALSRSIEADIAPGASLLACEALVFGRRERGERPGNIRLRDRWRIRHDGALVHAEETRIAGQGEELFARAAIAGGAGAVATLLLVSPRAEACVEPLRVAISRAGEITGGASFQPLAGTGKILARLVARDSHALRIVLAGALPVLNREAALPKLWSI
jgi:urease accessory protein